MTDNKEQAVQRLDVLVRKVKVLSQGASDVDCRIFPPQAHGQPFIVEVFKDRYSRRVPVDMQTLNRVMLGQADPGLMRDLRTAILAVMRLAQRSQN